MARPTNTFGWADISSTDQNAAKEFYSGLFGWEAQDEPMPEGGYYTNFTKGGKSVAGLGSTMAEGMPSMWNSYVMVDSADDATEAARKAGGQVFMEPMDVMEFGRMAFLADPSGAPFGVWESRAHKGAEAIDEPGTMMWNELATSDVDASKSFYEKSFGWSFEGMDMGEGLTYYVDQRGEQGYSGVMAIGGGWPVGTPSHWDVYFQVDDVDTTVKKAVELGGTDISGKIEVPGIGEMNYLQDPTGAFFYVMKPAPRES